MRNYMEIRVLDVANYMIKSKSTIRKTAKVFGVSKSTIHKDIKDRIKEVDPAIILKINTILDLNRSERHIRGGEATKLKYEKLKQIAI